MRRLAAILYASLASAQTWTVLAPVTAPGTRTDAAMASDKARGQTVLFGGATGALPLPVYSGETWLWNGAAWSRITPATSPSPRAGFAMAYDEARNETVLFGGVTQEVGYVAETWVWNGSTWTQRLPSASPPARIGAGLAWDDVRKQLVLFGGADRVTAGMSDTWTWDGSNWTRQTPAVSPPARATAVMAWEPVKQVVLMYGASQATGQPDTWSWNGSVWTLVSSGTNGPAELDRPVMVSAGNRVLLSAGSTANWQTWMWDGTSWQTLITNQPPEPAVSVAGVWDSVRSRAWFFGGVTSSGLVGTTSALGLGNACSTPLITPQNVVGASIASGGSGVFVPVPAGCAWSLTSSVSWLVPFPFTSGSGTLETTVYWSSNTAPSLQRTGTVRLGGTPLLTVTQPGVDCPSPGPLPASPVTLADGCVVTYTYTAKAGDQIAFRGVGRTDLIKSGSGSFPEMTLSGPAPSVATLMTHSPQYASITYLPASGVFMFPASGTYFLRFAATGGQTGQSTFEWMKTGEPCTAGFRYYSGFTLVPISLLQFDGRGFSYFLEVALPPGCSAPAVVASAPWLDVNAGLLTSGYNRFAATAAPNYGGVRSATLTIGSLVVPVQQTESDCKYGLSANTTAVGSGRSEGTLTLTASNGLCSWTASVDSPWLQLYPLRGAGTSSSVRYTVFPNFGTKARTAVATIASQTFAVTQAAATGSTAERFVRLLYFSFFGRMPSDAELAFQVGSGQSRPQLASNFFHSAEFNSDGRYVAGLYVGILNRDAEYGGWLFQRDALATGLTNPRTAAENFVSSQEFALKNGALDNAAFVRLLYRQVLLREASEAEVNFQASALASGTSRSELARNFLVAQEFLTGAGPRLTAFLAYATLLQRQATDAEMTSAGNSARLAQGAPDIASKEALIRDLLLTGIVNSVELAKILE